MNTPKKRMVSRSIGPGSRNRQRIASTTGHQIENRTFADIPEKSILKNPYSRFLSDFSRKVANLTNVTRVWSRTMTEDYLDDNDDTNQNDISNRKANAYVGYLPIQARFGSKLSPEAQFAMFRGYEDVLIGHIISSYPNYSQYLKRTKTPTSCTFQVDELESGFMTVGENIHVSMTSLHDKETEAEAISRTNYGLLSKSVVTETQEENLPDAILVNKQLRLTGRLEIAMDILDAVKEKQGMVVTSPRLSSRTIKPINNYIAWNRAWTKEFQMRNSSFKNYK